MNVQIIGPEGQARGEFDGGRIQEQKPIGFPGEGASVVRLGPLFYWAWAHAGAKALLGMHPHKGFEIMSYGIAGQGLHKDTLGSESILEAGDIQLMQTGSGVSHSEGVEEGYEGFQIWFEPHYSEALKRVPTYYLFKHEQFPQDASPGVTVKTILGEGSPVHIVTDAQMFDVEIDPGQSYTYQLRPNRILAGLAIRGDGGSLKTDGSGSAAPFKNKDFAIVQSEQESELVIQAEGQKLRIVLIEVPSQVDYPLYQKGR
ncbi:MAG: pirin [Paenibacillus sp.]|nr:pirin [Paenibacillus sp.]